MEIPSSSSSSCTSVANSTSFKPLPVVNITPSSNRHNHTHTDISNYSPFSFLYVGMDYVKSLFQAQEPTTVARVGCGCNGVPMEVRIGPSSAFMDNNRIQPAAPPLKIPRPSKVQKEHPKDKDTLPPRIPFS